MFRYRYLSLVLALSLGTSSCWFERKKPPRVFVPPPPTHAPKPEVTATQPPELPPAPAIDAMPEASLPLELPVNIPELAPPPAPPPRRPPPSPRATAPSTPPPPAPETTPPPRLGQIFTADQLREYNRSLDESLERVRRVLGMVAGKNLNGEQSEIVSRIQTFQKQAEQAREQDLVTAVNLARRADLLAQDLLKRLP
jgi:hypothetical protein